MRGSAIQTHDSHQQNNPPRRSRGVDAPRFQVVAFRGTSEPRDVVTDASAIMTPWARDAELAKDDYDDSVPLAAGDPLVHAGFRAVR